MLILNIQVIKGPQLNTAVRSLTSRPQKSSERSQKHTYANTFPWNPRLQVSAIRPFVLVRLSARNRDGIGFLRQSYVPHSVSVTISIPDGAPQAPAPSPPRRPPCRLSFDRTYRPGIRWGGHDLGETAFYGEVQTNSLYGPIFLSFLTHTRAWVCVCPYGHINI